MSLGGSQVPQPNSPGSLLLSVGMGIVTGADEGGFSSLCTPI